MKKVLVETTADGFRVLEIVAPGEDFPVNPQRLTWVDAPDAVSPGWNYDGSVFTPPPPAPPPPTPEEVVDRTLVRDRVLRAVLAMLAARFGVTPAELIAELKANM